MDAWSGWEHWYEVVETSTLRQGDVLANLLVFWFPQDLPVRDADPPEGRLDVVAEWDRGTWIVMSASCDVDREAARYPQVLMGRVAPATRAVLNQQTEKDLKTRLEVIRRGLDPSAFLLAPHPNDPPFPLSVVQWRMHVTLPVEYVRRAATGRRLRLKSPYRESFGNWVGGNIERVGPEDSTAVPKFRDTVWPEHVLRSSEEQ